jgi:hypothetical protein
MHDGYFGRTGSLRTNVVVEVFAICRLPVTSVMMVVCAAEARCHWRCDARRWWFADLRICGSTVLAHIAPPMDPPVVRKARSTWLGYSGTVAMRGLAL